MAAPDGEFFASLERNFIGIGCTMEAQTTASNSIQCGLFTGEYKKYTVSGVTFSFNNYPAKLCGISPVIIQQIVTMPIYGKEALNICHPYMTDILRYT